MYIISVIIYIIIICVIQTPGGIAGIDRHNSLERSDSTSSQQSSSQPLSSSLSSSQGTQQLKNAKSWTGMYSMVYLLCLLLSTNEYSLEHSS